MSSAPKISWFGRSSLLLGYLFLYVPIILLVTFSFNESRLATSWTGFSLKWYSALFDDASMLKAAWVSIKIAFFSASAAVVLATLAALAMRRVFRGKTLFQALITSPLVMPDIVIGLSLLLMFVTLFAPFGVSPKGMLSIWIAHVTFTMAFVTVIISSRLAELDKSLEEAAMDLGATRFKIFFVITLPIISPAMISGWLMAFTLSLDDVVISSFVAGPDATTLPMKIFSTVRMGLNPKINALASIIVAFVSCTAVIAWAISTREEKRRQRDIQLAMQKSD